jgi:hypothetical protein
MKRLPPPEDGGGASRPDAKPESRKSLQRRLAVATEEYRDLFAEAQGGLGPAITRRHELAKEMRLVSQLLHLREPIVEVTVTRSATGHPFRIGEKAYYPGTHQVKASVAQQLLWMMDGNRRQELARMQQNGFDVDLGTIGERARQVQFSREE